MPRTMSKLIVVLLFYLTSIVHYKNEEDNPVL